MPATLYHTEGVERSRPHAMLTISRIPLMHLLTKHLPVKHLALGYEVLSEARVLPTRVYHDYLYVIYVIRLAT